jgi:prephenate dehydratase
LLNLSSKQQSKVSLVLSSHRNPEVVLNLTADIFGAVSSTAQLGVVPQENTIFGTVLETYDVLRKPVSGFIRGEVTLQIQHCLLVRQGVELYDIQKVFSHEQVC